jgi:hypothetical protein
MNIEIYICAAIVNAGDDYGSNWIKIDGDLCYVTINIYYLFKFIEIDQSL